MQKLKSIRESKGITQTELARKSATTQCNISLYEYGKKSPRLETVKKIASALDVSWTDLVDA